MTEVIVEKVTQDRTCGHLEEVLLAPADEAAPRPSRPRAHNDPREKRRREKAEAEQSAAKEG